MSRSVPITDQTSQPSLSAQDTNTTQRSNISQREPTREESAQYAPTLPSVTTLTGYSPSAGSPAATRAFGVHSILNPAAETDPFRQTTRVSQSPVVAAGAVFGTAQTPRISPQIRKRKDDASPKRTPHTHSELRPARRVLTPRSPALRSASQGLHSSPAGRGNHQHGRVYTVEPGESTSGTIPPLPPMNLLSQGLNIPVQPHEQSNMATGVGYSSSTASYSATTQGHIGSPASSSNLGMADREPVDSTSAMINAQATPSTASHMMAATRAYGVGQPAYQMELSTESGPMILPVEVDVQQASKLADEKRKRNAGASARFRQRRKEKEQAASHHIADLQKQVRDMTEERDFYLTERNVFRDILSRTPGASIPPRPASPRMRRLQPHGQYVSVPIEPPPPAEYRRHDQGDPSPAQRRRTSAYQPSFAAASIPTTSYANPFPQPQGPAYTLPPPSLAPGLPDPRGQPPQPPAGSGLLEPPIPPRAPHQMPPALAPNPQPPNTRSAPYDSVQRDTQ